jgi:hypothetical protein
MICEMCKLDVLTLDTGGTLGIKAVCCFCSFTTWMPKDLPLSQINCEACPQEVEKERVEKGYNVCQECEDDLVKRSRGPFKAYTDKDLWGDPDCVSDSFGIIKAKRGVSIEEMDPFANKIKK